MKALFKIIFLSVCVSFSSWALADVKIAVVDQFEALTQSAQAKSMIQKMKAGTAADEQKLKSLETSLEALGKKLNTDAAVMSDAQKQKMIKDLEAKRDTYFTLRQKVQKRYQDGQQSIVQTLGPKFRQAIEQIIKKGNYDLVIQKQALVYAPESMDITSQVTAAIDAATKGK